MLNDGEMLRAYEAATSGTKRPWSPASRLSHRAVAALCVVTVAAVGGASAMAYYGLISRTAGFSSGFAALESLPAAQWPAGISRIEREHASAAIGLAPDNAGQRLRLLRVGLTLGPRSSSGAGRLYGLLGEDGAACYFLVDQSSGCLTQRNLTVASRPILASVVPGYPEQAPAIVGIVADNISGVTVRIGSRTFDLPIINNSIYSDLVPSDIAGISQFVLTVSYHDGASESFDLINPRS